MRGGALRKVKDALKAWCDSERSLGHELGADDLLDQFSLDVEDLIWHLSKTEGEDAALLDREIEEDDEEAKAEKERVRGQRQSLLQGRQFLESLTVGRQNRQYHKQSLLQWCEVVERKPDLVFPMSEEESRLLMKLGWQSFDRLFYLISHGSVEQLRQFVADPVEFMKHREELPVVATDAVPVYLDVATGKILVPLSCLDAAKKRRLAKRRGLEPEQLDEDIHLVAEGASRGEKDRMTWICRQVLYNAFKKGTAEEPAPRVYGEMLPSILLVHCSTFCRLENMCRETETWKEDEEFEWQGKPVVRKAGDKIPPNIMASWRKVDADYPGLLDSEDPDLLIWGSLNAYQNEVACAGPARGKRPLGPKP